MRLIDAWESLIVLALAGIAFLVWITARWRP